MTPTPYTPGPWYATDTDVCATETPADGGDIICEAPEAFEESMKRWNANAGLIAAAPDLLEALQEAVADLFYQVEMRHGPEKASKYPSIVKAKAAIAKATAE